MYSCIIADMKTLRWAYRNSKGVAWDEEDMSDFSPYSDILIRLAAGMELTAIDGQSQVFIEDFEVSESPNSSFNNCAIVKIHLHAFTAYMKYVSNILRPQASAKINDSYIC